MGGQDHSTRNVILTLLKIKESLSVNELARELGITEMAVRRHLNTLERDGLIRSKLVRQAMGRPVHIYFLTGQSEDFFPKKYHHLALELLEELEQEEGDAAVMRLFERRKARLENKYRQRLEGKPLEEKVLELAEVQNSNGYMVRLERDGKGNYVFVEHNCPISQVARKYQQACQCELSLFRALLNAGVERTECLAKGGNKCVYMIENQESGRI